MLLKMSMPFGMVGYDNRTYKQKYDAYWGVGAYERMCKQEVEQEKKRKIKLHATKKRTKNAITQKQIAINNNNIPND